MDARIALHSMLWGDPSYLRHTDELLTALAGEELVAVQGLAEQGSALDIGE